ncbi:MAG: oligosaccharide flippase family protein, partial [Planctomycetota bacterium]
LLTAQRRLNLGKLTRLDLYATALGIGAMVAWATVSPTVWALVAGGWTTAIIRTAASHFWLSDRMSRLRIEREAAGWIYKFVRWITMSTAFTFLAMQGDKLILAPLIDRGGSGAIEGEGVSYLAFYQLAIVLAVMPTEIVGKVATSVMFPAYAELSRKDPKRIGPALHRFRRVVVPAVWVGMFGLAVGARPLIGLMYDERYQDAGWMLEMLAVGGMFVLLRSTYNGTFIPLGKVSWMLWMTIVDSVLRLGLPVAGFYLGGPEGFVAGVVAAMALGYAVMATSMAVLGVWQRWLDAVFLALSFGAYVAAIYGLPEMLWAQVG